MEDITDISRRSRNNIFRKINVQADTSFSAASVDTPSPYVNKQYANCVKQFMRTALAHKVVVTQLDSLQSVPHAVADRLNELNVVSPLKMGQNATLLAMDWSQTGVTTSTNSFSDDEQAAISLAVCGIADTGSVVLISDPENPTRNNFLAAHHLVVLHQSTLVSYSENAWDFLRGKFSPLPRAINFISGPSSSADVGLKLEYGAHGPRSLTVFIIGNA